MGATLRGRFGRVMTGSGHAPTAEKVSASHPPAGVRRQNVTNMDVTTFEAERPRLTAIATRILGSTAEADDAVQEAWLRLSRTDQAGLDLQSLPAWLTTVVTRLCLDQLRKRRARSDAEAAAVPPAEESPDPESDALLAEQVGGAMHLVLDALAPAERVAFVLHDVFGYPFEDVAGALGRSPAAVRQLASRARRKVRGAPEPAEEVAARAEHRQVVSAFLSAARGGDLDTLLSLLAPDAVMRADAVGRQLGTEGEYVGAAAVAARFDGARGALPVTIDGDLGAAWILHREVKVAFAFHVADGLVREVELIADPEVLASMRIDRKAG
jgi:RNA polymerase sigma-70 factor (ECF subfamily)